MQQIADWLKTLGMSEYAELFAKNRIDFSVLPDLTDHDLEKLGVLLGDRRKMLRAIVNLEAAEKSAPALTVAAPASAVPVGLHDTAERRQVTVMFSDLVGSTALSGEWTLKTCARLSAPTRSVSQRPCSGSAASWRSTWATVCWCTLAFPRPMRTTQRGPYGQGLSWLLPLMVSRHMRFCKLVSGIATGLVVVGDLIGAGASQEQAIVGETPNLAARLQGIAEPNGVVIAESTRKLLGNLFELEDLGAKDLKGMAVPVRAWAALRASSVESRFEALHTSGLTALVGREEELAVC